MASWCGVPRHQKTTTSRPTTRMQAGRTPTSHPSTGRLPIPEDYGVSRETGFLPSNPSPLLRLPGSYFEPWEQIMDNLQALLLAGGLRTRVAKLPVLDASRLQGERQFQRAYVVLSFISHGYIWGKNQAAVEVRKKDSMLIV
jgi:hypothetical protein